MIQTSNEQNPLILKIKDLFLKQKGKVYDDSLCYQDNFSYGIA